MSSSRFPIPQGTLDMLILQILSLEPAHGYGIAQRLEQISKSVVQVNQGSLYPALHRLEQKGWLKAEWKQSETGREAKFYSLTRSGHKQLRVEKDSWARLTGAVQLIFDEGICAMKRILNWFRLRKLESDLDRELAYHIDRRVADLIHSGLPETEARRRAALELGGATQVREEVRDIWLTRWLRDFVYDLRFSARSFLRSPSFTATAVLSLALGIGATTAIYSLVDQVVLRALPVDHPERLVLIDWNGYQHGRDLRQCQLDVLPDLPRSPAAEAILRRRILPRCDNDQPLNGWGTHADCRGTRVGCILFGARSEPRAGKAVDDR